MTKSTSVSPSSMDDLRDSYVQLLKNALTMSLWDARDGSQAQTTATGLRARAKKLVMEVVGKKKGQTADSLSMREEGRDWPQLAHTMIGVKRMNNLQSCVETVIRDGIQGDLIETGVWRGGACIFMRGILKAYGVTDRTVWVADSFAGLPPPNPDAYPEDAGDAHHKMEGLAVSLEQVRSHFAHYGLLDDKVQFLKGWFKDTLPNVPAERFAVARLDGDMYESTMDALKALYPKLAPGGFLIVDDYGAVPGCKDAVEDYRREHGISDKIHQVDWTGVYWRRKSQ